VTTAPATTAIELDADLLSLGDVVRFPGERRRYRIGRIRRYALIPTRAQEADLPTDDRARIDLDLYPVSRGGSSDRRTVRPTDRVLTY
jgi:hypothetical protein